MVFKSCPALRRGGGARFGCCGGAETTQICTPEDKGEETTAGKDIGATDAGVGVFEGVGGAVGAKGAGVGPVVGVGATTGMGALLIVLARVIGLGTEDAVIGVSC